MSASAIYTGWVRHRRHAPQPHQFRYRLAQLWLDLDEVDQLFQQRWLWSVGRRNLAEFRRSDYLGDPDVPLHEAVRQRAANVLGPRPCGPIRLLTHLRYGGYVFNPVSFYYCYEPDGQTLDCIVAEVTNTPWGERHAYVLPMATAQASARGWSWQFDKAFHVSPFLPMACDYRWRFNLPADDLQVHMQVSREGQRSFDAHLWLRRRALDGIGLASVLAAYPLMTWQVLGAIHWQALRLWWKGNPVHDHPHLSGPRS